MIGSQDYDSELLHIAQYAKDYTIVSDEAYKMAHWCLWDALACGLRALQHRDCTRLLGPLYGEGRCMLGARVPGTSFCLPPPQAAFNIGVMNRWLDFNDTWLAKEWGHPSDNLGAILACADYLSQQALQAGKPPLTMRHVFDAMIRAYEIQGMMACGNAFNEKGLDHVILVKLASTAATMFLLQGTEAQYLAALSQVFVDGQALRTYRHWPNTGSRKSWAAGDATSRGFSLAWLSYLGEPGYPTALSAPKWGFYDVSFRGERFVMPEFGSHVIEHILFKAAFPAEFHGQTAVEAALTLHPKIKDHLNKITSIQLETQAAGMRIIHKTGPLKNEADRDHCLEYMVACALLFGRLDEHSYSDEVAADPRIDQLRCLMRTTEQPKFTADYYDVEKRAIPNRVTVTFADTSISEQVDYPIGHLKRRAEVFPYLREKITASISGHYVEKDAERLVAYLEAPERVMSLSVPDFVNLWLSSLNPAV
ncbi:MAG: bifunctional 2-methylcitrate dehydratase/aconitate hydratase [Pseudomonadota bacterium]